MTHISRPFQIALVALLVLVAVWFVLLRGHSSGSGSSASSTPASSQAAAPQAAAAPAAPGGGTPASQANGQHSSVPGVEGLSRAIQRARGAVAQSQQNAKQLQQNSDQASGASQNQSGQAQNSQAQSQSQSQAQSAQQGQGQSRSSSKTHTSGSHSKPGHTQTGETKTSSGAPAMQATVEGELEHGKTVAVLFWNPKGSVDASVRRELQTAKRSFHGRLAVHVARASEVGSFGSFTHAVQVYSTPTILLINTRGKTSSLAGLTDAFSIEQAVKQVKRAK